MIIGLIAAVVVHGGLHAPAARTSMVSPCPRTAATHGYTSGSRCRTVAARAPAVGEAAGKGPHCRP